jgi:hypothetical protein
MCEDKVPRKIFGLTKEKEGSLRCYIVRNFVIYADGLDNEIKAVMLY